MNKYNPVKYYFDVFKKLFLANEDAAQEYKVLGNEFALIAEMIRARKKAKKTQKEIAKLMKTSTSAISRLESLEGQKLHSPTLETLKKYAKAVDCHLIIKFKHILHKKSVSSLHQQQKSK